MGSNSRWLWGAAITVAGAFILMELFKTKKDDKSNDDTLKLIAALGTPEKDPYQGQLSPLYYKQFFIICMKGARLRFPKDHIPKRRELLSQNKMAEYKKLVLE